MIETLYKDTPASAYNPSDKVKELTMMVKQAYQTGNEILNRPLTELNERSVIEDMNLGQKTFNAFVDENITDPADAWKWRGTRSKARNKAIAMHAQITAGYIIPVFMAQNEDDEEDADFSDLMRDVSEWMVHNSNYKTSFLGTAMGMLSNPVTYLGADYAEVYQTIRKKTEQGYEKTEVMDEVLSGFQAPVYSADQILITNLYEQNIQRQKEIIKRRWIEYQEAEARYGEHEHFGHVQQGISVVFNESDNLFYEVHDSQHPFLVEEVTFANRRDDTEVCFLGGVYMGAQDIEHNPIRHRDNRDTPKYDLVPFGYQRINEHFFYYKSLMNSLHWDDMLIDAQYELAMNRAFLDTNMPLAISGSDKVDSEVIFPSSVVSFADKDVRVSPLLPAANLNTMFQAMRITEDSMEEGSVSETASGQLPAASTKATAIVLSERNAKTLLTAVGKTLAESIVQYGSLMADIATTKLSVAQIAEMTGDQVKLKYRTLILKDKIVGGKQTSKVLKFDQSLLGKEMTEQEKKQANLKLLEDSGYPDNKSHLYLINPELFAKMKYLTRVEPQTMFPKNEEFLQAMAVQVYQLFRADPLINPEALVREVANTFWRGRSDEFIAKKSAQIMQAPDQTPNPNAPQAGRDMTARSLQPMMVGA